MSTEPVLDVAKIVHIIRAVSKGLHVVTVDEAVDLIENYASVKASGIPTASGLRGQADRSPPLRFPPRNRPRFPAGRCHR